MASSSIRLTPFLILASLLSQVQLSQALAQCYYPAGNVEPGHVPCNQTTNGVSACCDPRDSCSQSGICLGSSGWTYRGSCTDNTWGSPNCAKQFPSCVTDASTNKLYAGFTQLWSCDQPGVAPDGGAGITFCCAQGDSSSSCCNASFSLGNTGAAFMPGLDALVKNLTSAASSPTTTNSSSNSSAPQPATTSCPPSSSANGDLGTKVGLGVGIPLGVLALGILGFLGWREYRKARPQAAADESGGGDAGKTGEPKGAYTPMSPAPQYSSAAYAPPPAPPQHVSSPAQESRFHEASADSAVQELGG